MESSTRMVIEEALRRHVDVKIIEQKSNFISLKRGSQSEIVAQATKTSKDSYITPVIMENKEVTKQLLHANGISVPMGLYYHSLKEALNNPMPSGRLVVKPNTTNFGIGIHFINSGDVQHYKRALKKAFDECNEVVVEPFVLGEEYRFLIINGKISAIGLRDPAHVIGNGSATVAQLAEQKRRKTEIRPEVIERLALDKRTPETVPKKGEKVYLRTNSNVSTGGEITDLTDTMSTAYRKIALKAAQSVGATFCGVDMIIKDVNCRPNRSNHAIIELNFNPALYLHQEPDHGKGRNVAGDVLDCLGFPFIPITKCDCS